MWALELFVLAVVSFWVGGAMAKGDLMWWWKR